jgi:hypothetical protein
MYLAMCAATRFSALRKKGEQASTSDGPDREIGLCWGYIGDNNDLKVGGKGINVVGGGRDSTVQLGS